MSNKITLTERLHNFAEIWGFAERPPTVECIPDARGMLPTASGDDDGHGWEVVDGDWVRPVRTSPPPADKRHLWSEGSPGVYHRK